MNSVFANYKTSRISLLHTAEKKQIQTSKLFTMSTLASKSNTNSLRCKKKGAVAKRNKPKLHTINRNYSRVKTTGVKSGKVSIPMEVVVRVKKAQTVCRKPKVKASRKK